MEFVTANGATLPMIGLGTWELKGRSCARTVEQALRAGYKLIDTAEIYDNERDVGDGVRASGLRRAEVFVTTKVWTEHLAPRELERATKASLARLRLSEVDLLLIHWPNPRIPLAETIGALCKMKRAGFARHIGVSNFTVALLDEAMKHTTELLAVNQIEWHPHLDQTKVVAACRRHGMAVVAYSPMGRGAVLSEPVIREIAVAHGKSPAQISLRYIIQEGGVVVPRTARLDRLTENLAVFDFVLDEAEMVAIRGLARPNGRIVDWSGAPAWD
ncbi:2,5-diketo-D-gluconic acid reductase B [Rhodoplanes serenus]|uniref:2,5-diketo-D-gluconic acid reductase B n=1 Tax=Rhodoplanes serenus TaxID=200615 RepID=A0A447D2C1_9BRAD|nr:aldo/keto reductase [Rhodoplanes serenus]VCU11690.1 2,5-diketo-D-gluconic acid reductase B [Rhodoplanes serenus]